MLTDFFFSKESVVYSRDALKVSHFSGTSPVSEEGVLASGVSWEGQLIHRDWNCPVLLPLHGALQPSLMFNYFLLSCDSRSSTQWVREQPAVCPAIPVFPVLGTTVRLSLVCTQHGAEVLDQWHFSGQLVPRCLSVRRLGKWQRRTWDFARVLPGTACLLPERRGVSW